MEAKAKQQLKRKDLRKSRKGNGKKEEPFVFPVPLTDSPQRQTQSVNREILSELKRTLDANRIREKARRNDEKPFGYVLDYIKDMYGLTKSEAWDTAAAVCSFFKV